MRLGIHTLMMSAVLCAACLTARGQARDYDYIKETNLWLGSRNAAGIGTFDMQRIAVARAYAVKENGGLVGIEGSDDSIKGALETESYNRISDRMSFYGLLSYDYFYGKNMGGPILLDPSYNPVSFIEADETTTGPKSREYYKLIGAASYKLSDKWYLGGRVDYETALSAKRKDPRFRSIWMDLNLDAGVMFRPSEHFSAGISLIYRRSLEKFDGTLFGDLAKDYISLVDYGGFLCKKELFSGDNGYVPQGSGTRNMFNAFYGCAIELEGGSERIRTFHELYWKHRDGYYGNKGTSHIVYSEHGGDVFGYSGSLLLKGGNGSDKLSLTAELSRTANSENVFRTTTPPGQQTVIEYLSSKEVLDRQDLGIALDWQGRRGPETFCHRWHYGASLTGDLRKQTATIYPFYRNSSIWTSEAAAFATRNISRGKNIFSTGLRVEGAFGGGTPKEDGAHASTSSDAPYSADGYLLRDFEFKSALVIRTGASFRYTRTFNDRTAAYVELSDKYARMTGSPEYLGGKDRNTLILSVGCTF